MAVTMASVSAATSFVRTVKIAVVAPGATATDEGTSATPSLLETNTSIPPPGAAPLSATVACVAPPAGIVVSASHSWLSVGGVGVVGGVSSHPAIALTTTSAHAVAATGRPAGGRARRDVIG
jgi:hypothetical protein